MRTALLPLCLLLASFSPAPQEAVAADDATSPPSAVAVREDVSTLTELDGVFVPADLEEVSLWPQAFSGEILFLEVVPHGTFVNEGDRLATLDLRSIDEAIADAERELRSAEVRLQNTQENAAVQADAARASLSDSRSALERARLSLEGWEKHELELRRRQEELSRQYGQHAIDDATDELAQLELMYGDDELVDATEEIVIKRSRRDLARSRTSLKLQHDRDAFELTYEVGPETRRRHEAVARQEGTLERLTRTQAIARRSSGDELARSQAQLDKQALRLERLRRDREAMEIRAPRSGVVLHGGADELGPSKVRPDHRRGSRGSARAALFTVANPDRLALSLTVSESQLGEVRTGMGARVEPVVDQGAELVGTLRVERYPTPASAASPENAYRARVELERGSPGIVFGMRAQAVLETETLKNAILVPAAAVFGGDSEPHCWASAGGDQPFLRVEVELGPTRGEERVVTSGIEAGQRVLLAKPQGQGTR